MIALSITNTKQFMSKLLMSDTFDRLLLSEASIDTVCHFQIRGSLTDSYFTEEERTALSDPQYVTWACMRPHILALIRGKKAPASMKIILLLPADTVADLVSSQDTVQTDEVDFLCLNIHYSQDVTQITTGTSLRIFTMDKTFEHTFDAYIRSFLENAGISCSEI